VLKHLRALLASPLGRRLRRPSLLGAMGVRPLSTEWGYDRGTPVDLYYIERFLAAHAADIRGRTLEVKNAGYTRRFGSAVTQADVLDIDARNVDATIIADLSVGEGIPERAFDCFVITQTLQFIYDVHSAVVQSHRLLRPGGVLLATVPIVARISPRYGLTTEYWRFTPASCARMFGDVFGAEQVTVRTDGNVFAGVAFLRGAALEELPRRKLDVHDPYFPILATVRAVRSTASGGSRAGPECRR
jgi:SAM-dependent methyltransferase